MGIGVLQVRQVRQGPAAVLRGCRGHGQGDEHLVRVEARVAAAQVLGLEGLDRFDRLRGQQVRGPLDPGQVLERVQQHRGGAPQQRTRLAGHEGAVVQADRRRRGLLRLRQSAGRTHDRAVVDVDARAPHDEADALGDALVRDRALFLDARLEPAPDDLLARRLAAHRVVRDARPHEVDPHVRGGAVRAAAVDPLQQRGEEGEDLDVAVVGRHLLAVRAQMVRVDDVEVLEIRRRRLVREVDGVLERQVPHRERLELRVAGGDAPPVVVVDLRQARRELAGPGARRRQHDEVARGLEGLVAAEALLAHDPGHVCGVAGDRPVADRPQAQALEPIAEPVAGLVRIVQLRDDDVLHEEAAGAEGVDEPQDLVLVRDPQVRSHLVPAQIAGVDGDDDLQLVAQLLEHRDLRVRGEPGQHARGVQVVEELPAHLQVESAADLPLPGADAVRLEGDVALAVEADLRDGTGGGVGHRDLCAWRTADRHEPSAWSSHTP